MSGLGDEGSASPLSSPPESLFDFRDNAEKASYHRSPHASKVDHSSIAVQMDEDTAEGSIAVRASNRTTVASRPKGAPANLSKKRKALTPTKVAASSKKARNEAKKWQSPFVYTDPKTPLARADLRSILLNSQAWDVLNEDEQKIILGLLPEHTHMLLPGASLPRPNVELLRNNDTFRFDMARYCESIEAGKHDPEWLNSAWTAHEKRSRGDFDDYQVKQFEKGWSTSISPEHYPKALRRAGQADEKPPSKSGGSGGAKTTTPREAAMKGGDDAKSSSSKDQSGDSPLPASSHSSSVERKIAKVNIAREDSNGGSRPTPLSDMVGVEYTSQDTADSIVVSGNNQT